MKSETVSDSRPKYFDGEAMMNQYTTADLTMKCRARVAKDGTRIMCDARNRCGGVLGEIGKVSAFVPINEGELTDEIKETLIILPAGFAGLKNGTWRQTRRPAWRGQTRLSLLMGGRRVTVKDSDKPITIWGMIRHQLAEYILPVEVVCPRCKRVNLITDALIPRP